MAPFPQYAEYELRNSNAYARRFPLLVPYVGEVVFPNCRKLPYISEVADSDADETGENTQTGADQSLGTQRRASQRRLYAQGVVMGVNQNIRKRQHPETSALKNANHHPRI